MEFFWGLRKAPSQEVVSAPLLVFRDKRSTLARNLDYGERQTGQDPWTASPQLVRSVMQLEVGEPPPEDTWRLPYLDSASSRIAWAWR